MRLMTIFLAASVLLPVPSAAAPAGEVVLVTGVATVGARPLSVGDAVNAGETVVTGNNSYANLRFADGGRVLLRPNTEFTVEAYEFEPAAPKPAAVPAAGAEPPEPVADGVQAPPPGQNAFFRLVRGGFRAISGLIGQGDRAAYRVTTPNATIGIRGTDYEAQLCSGDCPDVTPQSGEPADQGLVVATNEGSIVLETPRGSFTLEAGQVALALASGQVFQLPAVPDLMLMYPTPRPDTCQ